MKKIICFIICFLFLIPFALADYQVTNYRVDITILENGDLRIVEMFRMKGTYNGYERTVNYRNNYQGYKGDMLTSFDKNLYNGDRLTLNEVRAINYSNDTDIEEFQENGDLFTLVDEATKGDHSVYTITQTEDGQIYKIYNPSRMNKDFYIDYTLENMVINHEDVAELAMYLFSHLEENINNLEVTIHIPGNEENLRIWTHGGEDVQIEHVDEETVVLNIDSLNKEATFDFRLIFDNEIVTTNKTTEEIILDKIVELEENLDLDAINPQDEEYNQQREEAYNSVNTAQNTYNRDDYNLAFERVSNLRETDELKTELLIRLMNIEPKIERREEILKVVLTSIITIWTIGLIVILYQIYKKYNHQVTIEEFKLNKDINPFKIGYLLRKKVNNYDLASSLLYLIEKKVITFDEKRRILKKNKSSNLSASEEKIIKMFLGEKNKVTLEDIIYYSQEDFDEFLKNYSNWLNFASEEAEKENYYENLLAFKIVGIIYCVVGIFLGSFLVGQNTYYSSIVVIVLSIIFLLYFILFKKRTFDGLIEYRKYTNLKKMLVRGDISNLDNIPYYLMYANSMGCFNKFCKRLDEYETEQFRAKTIRETIVLTIKKAYEARNNAHSRYAKVKMRTK